MKMNNFAGLSLCIGAAAVVVSCSGNVKQDAAKDGMPVLEFEGYRYDMIASVADSDALDTEGGAHWRLRGNGMLPVKIGDNDITELRDSLQRLGGVLVIDRSHSEPVLEEGLTPTVNDPESTKACSVTYNQLSVALCTPSIIVWKDYSYWYLCMSAHGSYNTTYLNYSIADGKILSVGDLMNPGYEKALAEMIRRKLSESGVSLLVPLEEVPVPNDFEITTQGLRFIYGLYEIAPYVEGEISVEFDNYELDDLFAPGVAERYFNIM